MVHTHIARVQRVFPFSHCTRQTCARVHLHPGLQHSAVRYREKSVPSVNVQCTIIGRSDGAGRADTPRMLRVFFFVGLLCWNRT